MQSEILAHQEEQGLPKELHEGGSQEVASCKHDASKDLESGEHVAGSQEVLRASMMPARTWKVESMWLGSGAVGLW